MTAGAVVNATVRTVVTIGTATVVIPEAAVGVALVGAVVVVGGIAWMATSAITGRGFSFKFNRDGVGVNMGPGNQSQAEV